MARLESAASADDITPGDQEALLEIAFDRYFDTASPMGTVEHCVPLAQRLTAIGVDELACLLDLGMSDAEVLLLAASPASPTSSTRRRTPTGSVR